MYNQELLQEWLLFFKISFTQDDKIRIGELIQAGVDINYCDDDGVTLLMMTCKYAAGENVEDVIKMLINARADINLVDSEGWSALMFACCYSGSTSTENAVKMLLENGAEVDLFDEEDWTALMLACRYANKTSTENTVKMLIEYKANLNLLRGVGWSALMLAIIFTGREYDNNVEYLPKITPRKNDMDALLFASKYAEYISNENVVKLLVNARANVNLVNCFRESALMFAARNANKQGIENIVKILIDNGATMNLIDYIGQVGTIKGSENIFKILIEKGANVNAVNGMRDTPLLLAVQKNMSSEIVRMLINAGANVNAVNNLGYSILAFVSSLSDHDEFEIIIKMLIDAGANINYINPNGLSILHLIIGADNKKTEKALKMLIDAGVDVNLASDNMITPLMLATVRRGMHNVENVVKLLLDAGANPMYVSDTWPITTFTMACQLVGEPGTLKTFKMLLEASSDIKTALRELCDNPKMNESIVDILTDFGIVNRDILKYGWSEKVRKIFVDYLDNRDVHQQLLMKCLSDLKIERDKITYTDGQMGSKISVLVCQLRQISDASLDNFYADCTKNNPDVLDYLGINQVDKIHYLREFLDFSF